MGLYKCRCASELEVTFQFQGKAIDLEKCRLAHGLSQR